MRWGLAFVAVWMLALSACGSSSEDTQARPALEQGFLGPVAYRYDATLLTAADVRVNFPAALGQELYAVKLVPARGIEGSPDLCPDGAVGCPVEVQPGLTLALLERPYARYAEALRASDLASQTTPTSVAGTEGLAVDGGTEGGLEVEYSIIPVDNRALLIKRQRDHQSEPERQALDAVVASLALGD